MLSKHVAIRLKLIQIIRLLKINSNQLATTTNNVSFATCNCIYLSGCGFFLFFFWLCGWKGGKSECGFNRNCNETLGYQWALNTEHISLKKTIYGATQSLAMNSRILCCASDEQTAKTCPRSKNEWMDFNWKLFVIGYLVDGADVCIVA